MMIVAMAACTSAFDQRAGVAPPDVADLLWAPAGAAIQARGFQPTAVHDGRTRERDGSASLAFSWTGPRDEVSNGIVAHLAARGWRPQLAEYLNPDTPTAFAAGWSHRCACVLTMDAAGKPIQRQPLYQWRGEWEDAYGNLITYSLSAEGPSLTAYAAFIPRDVVRYARRWRAAH